MVSNSGTASSGTVDKAVQVLRALAAREGPRPLGELAELLDMPKATVHRLLASLITHELVEAREGGRYALGVGLVRLGLAALDVDPLVRLARAELERAALVFGETFFLVAPRAQKLVVLDRAEGSGVLRAAPQLGSEVPVASTASGRLILAHAPELVRHGERLRSEQEVALRRVLRAGYDVNEDEWIAGLTVVAAPLVARGRCHGTVACAGVSAHLCGERLAEAVERTVRLARRIEAVITGVEGAEP
jgi:IclR family transcriptional regulator, acetate operon repressor